MYNRLHFNYFLYQLDNRGILFAVRKLMDVQTEVCCFDRANRAGKLPAPVGGCFIRCMTDIFRYPEF